MNEKIEKLLTIDDQEFEVFYQGFMVKMALMKAVKPNKYDRMVSEWQVGIEAYKSGHSLTPEQEVRLVRLAEVL